ncbi:O-acyltransferase, WSD1, C-terminal [Cynara cardunculus var. scolymus]|uniref:O-acyltransferase, WSD1, C-terminal n=1 Tax=Cynara cardunculus var. scolymus TaxID=59895 RepID=A0A103XE26_CYNCS|nr:O-acyltransferase, WSD1, C-terminal [Cynara cardunculus var. scolymus]
MESLIEGITRRKTALKPIKITKRNPTTTISNHHDGGGGVSHDDDGVDNQYMIVSGEEEPLSPSARLFHEPNFNVHVIAIMGSKNPIDPRVAYEKLPQTLLKHHRFSSLQVVDDKNGGMKWVPTNVNLHDHIIIPTIPQTLESPDKFLQDYVYNLSKTSIDSSKPMWDLHLLNLKTSDAVAIGIFRIHHSLGDGTSLMSLLLACTRQISNPDAVPTIPTSKTKNSGWFSYYSSSSGGGGPWWRRWFMTVCMVFWLVWNTLVDVTCFMATAVFLTDTETPLKAPAGAEFTPRRFLHRTVSLDDMKLIKNAMNTTINDVALGHGKEDESTISTEKKNNLPKKKIRLRSTLLVNIRPSSGIQALADMMEKDTEAKWGNSIGYVFLPFTIGIKDDPIDYIRDAKAMIDRKKLSLEALYTASIVDLVLKFFGIKASSMFARRIFSHTTLVFSNMVGPIEEIEFYGHTLEYLAPCCYGQPHGLMINLQSYVNKMTIVLSVDERIIPDPQKLLDDLEDSLKLIKEAVYAKGLVKDG